MLSSSRKLARARLNGLLLPCRTQQWHRGFGAHAAARAPLPIFNTSAASNPRLGPNATETFAPKPSDAEIVDSPTRQTPPLTAARPRRMPYGNMKDDSHELHLPKDPSFTKPLITDEIVHKSAAQYGVPLSFAYQTARRVNREIMNKDKLLTTQSLSLVQGIRLTSLFSAYQGHRDWKYEYKRIWMAKLNNRHIEGSQGRAGHLDANAKYLLNLAREDCYGSFQKAWEEMEPPDRARVWQPMALWFIHHDQETALDFLLVTTKPLHKPDFKMVGDCLVYLDRFYFSSSIANESSDAHDYAVAIADCIKPENWPIVNPSQRGLRLFIKRAPSDQVQRAFRLVKERGTTLEAITALSFMSRLIQINDVDLAFEALELVLSIKDPDFTPVSLGVSRHCCKLLKLDEVEDNAEGRNFRILPRLLKMGIRPDRDMMNVVLANAFKTGDSQLGADMLAFMRSHHHVFDSYTYVTLLTDAVARGDHARVEILTQEVELQHQLAEDPFVFSKLFHAHFTSTMKDSDPETDSERMFSSMLEMYNRFHDISPLKELLILPSHYNPPPGGLAKKLPPSPVALFLMIASFFRCKNRYGQVHRVYEQFREMVQMGHPSIAPLAGTDHVYNEFLVAFRRSPHNLRASVRLVEDMLNSSSLSVRTGSETVFKHTAPTLRTWTILLSVFYFHRQPHAADKIKEMMAKYNVKYSQATWNTIIGGHVSMQNIPEVASSIRQMEEQGFAIDHHTMKSLRYLRDPERLWVSVEELDQGAKEGGKQASVATELTPDERTAQQKQDELVALGLQKLESNSKPLE
ncbi:unnamed protein product [Penicillium olsonii]|uniref:Pentatricopeptide repeat protein n=1 Tax=Penicillium olsonii TaxID=99116 RepID=A0A9W4I2Z7_PENOL|nr:unnamed protein product [Penicillium olsonii]CAG8132277.1 unnamed protein product [Penicillium olsonii]CAG8212006.1 unnamed protein product [Penicillium olsonii]